MARARLLKPGFFANARLSEVSAHGRLLFAGLWTLADREGRLRDDSRWIKGQLFPYENPPVHSLLNDLYERNFIVRYQTQDGEGWIQIVNFLKHQTPHIREAPSTIPAPDEHSAGLMLDPEKASTSPAVYGIRYTVPVYGSGEPGPRAGPGPVPLTEEIVNALVVQFPTVNVRRLAEELQSYSDDHPKKYKSLPRTLKVWCGRREDENAGRQGVRVNANPSPSGTNYGGWDPNEDKLVLDT